MTSSLEFAFQLKFFNAPMLSLQVWWLAGFAKINDIMLLPCSRIVFCASLYNIVDFDNHYHAFVMEWTTQIICISLIDLVYPFSLLKIFNTRDDSFYNYSTQVWHWCRIASLMNPFSQNFNSHVHSFHIQLKYGIDVAVFYSWIFFRKTSILMFAIFMSNSRMVLMLHCFTLEFFVLKNQFSCLQV